MKYLAIILPALALAGCDASSPDKTAPAADPPRAERTSIIRPEIATPEPTAEPLRPITVTIGFADGEDALTPAAIAQLERLMTSAQLAQGGAIAIGAHTDSGGSDAANKAAARKRGELVRSWLLERGVDEERLRLVAFGEDNPVQPNALSDGTPNEAGRRANRRVEITVAVRQTDGAAQREPTVAEEIGERMERAEEP